MSDYMFMLENHLSAGQIKMIGEVQTAATEANIGLYLSGGALRDMLGGFPIREIDFTVEGSAAKLARSIASKTGAEVTEVDEHRKFVRMEFPGDARTTIATARVEKYPKPGGRPQVQPATIHEDLRCRDFTINAIALSLSRASRGLLVDPNNGIGDLERKELRAVSNYALYDDPIRMLRLIRLRARLAFTIDERTWSQYQNVREAGLEMKITAEALLDELHHIADEADPSLVLAALDEEKLLKLFSPALAGAKLNIAGFQKLLKAKQMIPFGADLKLENFGLFMYVLTEKLTPKEKSTLISSLGMSKDDVNQWQKLEARSKKLESVAKSARLQKASQVYHAIVDAPADEVLFLLTHSAQRLVQDRIKNYLTKYLPAALEVTDRDVEAAAVGIAPGSPKYKKIRDQLITTKLDSRPKKAAPPEEVPAPPPPAVVGGGGFGRKQAG
jgi:tRNA nucleotidyltransferase (CCA-adding enzyme)